MAWFANLNGYWQQSRVSEKQIQAAYQHDSLILACASVNGGLQLVHTASISLLRKKNKKKQQIKWWPEWNSENKTAKATQPMFCLPRNTTDYWSPMPTLARLCCFYIAFPAKCCLCTQKQLPGCIVVLTCLQLQTLTLWYPSIHSRQYRPAIMLLALFDFFSLAEDCWVM